jgi:hypothetical protein
LLNPFYALCKKSHNWFIAFLIESPIRNGGKSSLYIFIAHDAIRRKN